MHQTFGRPTAAALQGIGNYLRNKTEQGHPSVTPEHDVRWLSVLHEALAHQPILLHTTSGGNGDTQITGYLPLALVKSALFGRFLVSLPYLNRAGVVADDDESAQALIGKAIEIAHASGARYLELRHQQPTPHEQLPMSRDEKMRMVLTLPPDEEALFKAVGPKVRNLIRKGDKSELTMRWGADDVLDDFYGVFAVNMRDLGTPVYPRKLFGKILEHFAGEAELAVVYQHDKPIAGALLVHDAPPEVSHDATAVEHGTRPCPFSTQVPSASSLREYNSTNANMWMYHRLLLRAMERGAKEFDFGRSSLDSGTYKFKKQWGAEPHPTVWQYHVIKGDMNAMRPDNDKNQRRVEMWKKMPVWATRLIGPSIVRGIP